MPAGLDEEPEFEDGFAVDQNRWRAMEAVWTMAGERWHYQLPVLLTLFAYPISGRAESVTRLADSITSKTQ